MSQAPLKPLATESPMNNSHGYVYGNEPNVIVQVPPSSNEPVPLNKCEWYFGNISREKAREKLLGCCDGSFLVRDATSGNGEYTLTLKKDGTDRVIKIFVHNDGRYGFTKGGFGLNFASVPDLVNYYRSHSLKDYNTILDITLLYPLRAEDEIMYNPNDIHKLVQKYLDLHKELQKQQSVFDNHFGLYKRVEHDLDIKRQAFEAFHEAEQLFKEQLRTQERLQPEAQPHEIKSLQENMDLLKNRLNQLSECQQDLQDSYEKQQSQYLALERKIQSLKPILNELRKSEEKFLTQLNKNGIKDNQIKEITEHGYKAWVNQESLKLPHLEEETWFLKDISRAEAEQLLTGMPTGTFLVRARSAGDFALSISCNGTINHCIIHQTDSGLFGFAEPFNIFESLKVLVNHYAQNSLEEHNDLLQTNLRWPVRCSYIENFKTELQQKGSCTVLDTENVFPTVASPSGYPTFMPK